MSPPQQLLAAIDFSQHIKKSRFLAQARAVADAATALEMLGQLRHDDANHQCWAYRIGDVSRSNDDGEPSGTAGRPILQAIDAARGDGLLVVVSRWFGGIKLGTGGLIRAYGGTAAECLRQARWQPRWPSREWQVQCPPGSLALLRHRLLQLGAQTLREVFAADGVHLYFAAADRDLPAIQACIAAITRRDDGLHRAGPGLPP